MGIGWCSTFELRRRSASATPSRVYQSTDAIIGTLVAELQPGDQVVIMSNGGFEGIHRRLMLALECAVASCAG